MSKTAVDTVGYTVSGDGEAASVSVSSTNATSPYATQIVALSGGLDSSLNVPQDVNSNPAKAMLIEPMGVQNGNFYLDGSGGYGTGFRFDGNQPVRVGIPTGVSTVKLGSSAGGLLRVTWL